jgi:hypothetical protein
MYSSPLPDSVAILDTLAIPANAPVGPLTIAPFILDSLGQRTIGPVTILNIQPPSAINSTPVVQFSHTARVEVNDTIHVDASDQTGIVTLGYEVRRTPGGTLDAKDSLQSNGNITCVCRTRRSRRWSTCRRSLATPMEYVPTRSCRAELIVWIL